MHDAYPHRRAGGLSWAALRAELAPQPGRRDATVRTLVACLLVVSVSMALQIPNAALSAYMVFFISREDMASTTATGIGLVVAICIAIGLTLLTDLITIDAPALRLCMMTVLFCAGMYLSRVFVSGPLGFGLGFVLLLTQSTVDLYPAAEPLVRDTLWILVAVVFAVAVTVTINVIVLPARPLALLRQEMRACLDSVIAALDAQAPGAPPSRRAPRAAAPPGLTRTATFLNMAAGGDHRIKAQLPRYGAILTALDHLVDAAAMLGTLTVPLTPPAQARLPGLRAACARLREALDDGDVHASVLALPPDAGDDPIVREMAHHVRRIAMLWHMPDSALPEAIPAARPRLFVADAISNPAHLQFALKATFASMLCYIFYTAVAWPGIHTCVITCAVIALTSTGATIHKATLRIAGALTGGALALLATVFVVPELDSLGGLLLMIAPVVAASAWIGAGSERSAYFGWQLAFAFFVCTLHGFAPSTDVTLVRDRLVGIIVGIAVMGVIFSYVWPERAGSPARTQLARALRASVALLRGAPGQVSDFASRRGTILRALSDAERLARVAAFDGTALDSELTMVRRAVEQAIHLAQRRADDTDAAERSLAMADTLAQAAQQLEHDGGHDAT